MAQISHGKFQTHFIWWALGVAILGGFMLGAILAIQTAFQDSLSSASLILIQTHGHLQLMGWVGLFIMGVSLHFMPRMLGRALKNPAVPGKILLFMIMGLLAQAAGTMGFAYAGDSAFPMLFKALAAAGILLEWQSVGLYIYSIINLIPAKGAPEPEAVKKIKPFLLMLFSGWLIYSLVHGVAMFFGIHKGALLMVPAWNLWAVDVFMYFSLFPVVYAFSVRTFPLFLQTPVVIKKPVHIWALIYLALALIERVSWFPWVLAQFPEGAFKINLIFRILRDAWMAYMVVRIDLFCWFDPSPWVSHVVPPAKPPRPGLADSGEFGIFEWAIYTSFGWLLIHALLDAMGAAHSLWNIFWSIPTDPVRHAFLLGFVTLIIFGMAVRMLPGFMAKRKSGAPNLVLWGVLFGNLAVLTRVVPPFIDGGLHRGIALSGVFGIMTVVILARILYKTSRIGA